MMYDKIKANRGASKKFIIKYCTLDSFESISLVEKTINCFILFGILNDMPGKSYVSVNVLSLSTEWSWKYSFHSCFYC